MLLQSGAVVISHCTTYSSTNESCNLKSACNNFLMDDNFPWGTHSQIINYIRSYSTDRHMRVSYDFLHLVQLLLGIVRRLVRPTSLAI